MLRNPRELYNHSEPDLALRLWTAVRTGRYIFRKVKAHTDIAACDDLQMRYDRIGNMYADESAQKVCREFNLRLIEDAQGVANRLGTQHDLLRGYFTYFLDLQMACAKMKKQTHQLDQHELEQDGRETVSARLARYTLTEIWQAGTPTYDHSKDNAWGATWGRLFFNWLGNVRWPSAESDVADQHVGITWIELAISLMLWSKQWLPLRRKGRDDRDVLIVFANLDELAGYQVKLSEFAETVSQMFTQFSSLVDVEIIPPLGRRLVTSAYIQGFVIHSAGLAQRPMLPNQAEVADLLAGYLKTHKGPAWTALLDLGFRCDTTLLEDIRAETRGFWSDRCLKSQRSAMKLRRVSTDVGQTRLVFH
eukprot:Skav222151  [mRNA]  locus=scaffold2756:24903:25991:+ [translate_table: standard]